MDRKANLEIRKAIGAAGLRQWEVADALGILDSVFSRKLRRELPNEEKEHILHIIAKLEKREV